MEAFEISSQSGWGRWRTNLGGKADRQRGREDVTEQRVSQASLLPLALLLDTAPPTS